MPSSEVMQNPYEASQVGIQELQEDVSHSPYFSPDVAPTRISERKWGTWDMAALWVGMCACIPSYQLASGLIKQGMNWWQAALTVTLGNGIVLLPMILNAHAGTKYGIPFPVFCRASFGIRGANIAAMMRAMVACGWFGIQTWIGGTGFYVPLLIFFPDLAQSPVIGVGEFNLGINVAQFGCFMAFWAINIWIIYAGIESIRIFMNLATPILIIIPLALLLWAINRAGGLSVVLNTSLTTDKDGESALFWKLFVPGLTGIIGFWSTLSLNIPDFSRYAKSQRAQMLGQAIGLPTTMGLYALIGVLVTSATIVIYGEAIWDPNELLRRFSTPEDKNALVVVTAALALAAATLSTNIAANVVGPANDFANLAPKWISFKTGGLITGIIGIVMIPWKLVADPTGYIFTWLIGYSSLLGAIGGIMIVDYFFIRRCVIDLPQLYKENGKYWYSNGFNAVAILAFLAGVLPCVPGFLHQVHWDAKLGFPLVDNSFWTSLYEYAWFVSFGIAGVVYGLATVALKAPSRFAS